MADQIRRSVARLAPEAAAEPPVMKPGRPRSSRRRAHWVAIESGATIRYYELESKGRLVLTDGVIVPHHTRPIHRPETDDSSSPPTPGFPVPFLRLESFPGITVSPAQSGLPFPPAIDIIAPPARRDSIAALRPAASGLMGTRDALCAKPVPLPDPASKIE